jgi:acyl transferase domain-containing protein
LRRFGALSARRSAEPAAHPDHLEPHGPAADRAQATDPDYWVAHLRGTVMFAACMATLMATPGRVFLEMGPGRALSSLAQANGMAAGQVIPALRHPEQAMADDAWHIASLARLWACGVPVDWAPIWGEGPRHRVPLPTYPFQRKRYFIEPGRPPHRPRPPCPPGDDIAAWGWRPHWRPAAAACEVDVRRPRWPSPARAAGWCS